MKRNRLEFGYQALDNPPESFGWLSRAFVSANRLFNHRRQDSLLLYHCRRDRFGSGILLFAPAFRASSGGSFFGRFRLLFGPGSFSAMRCARMGRLLLLCGFRMTFLTF